MQTITNGNLSLTSSVPFRCLTMFRKKKLYKRAEDGPEFQNALSSGQEDNTKLWSGSTLSSRRDELQGRREAHGPKFLNSFSSRRECKVSKKISANSGQEIPCQAEKTNTNGIYILSSSRETPVFFSCAQ
ncbi:hypothetical protein CHS0354_005436 [Potamilus streckersoni]|uniref:Uncharacterized protein n=1 Tax=Potamilus streckersoni TaxID=2493646 RepID=A0AAE0TJE4_9BIVA|nr:hypothetical protein CHS0354_005436 [Potamilus streckersoni]